jgi:hypothetical protein
MLMILLSLGKVEDVGTSKVGSKKASLSIHETGIEGFKASDPRIGTLEKRIRGEDVAGIMAWRVGGARFLCR